MPKMLSSAKAQRLRRQAEQACREKRRSLWLLAAIILLVVGAVVADFFFIRWQRHQQHLRHRQRESWANRPAATNQPLPGASTLPPFLSTNSQIKTT